MGSEKYNLLIEILKFIELCQEYLKSGKIGLKDYHNMTGLKLQFIDSLLQEDRTLLKENTYLLSSLNTVIINHYILSNSSESIILTDR